MRPLASTPSNICKERVFSQVATFLPSLPVFQGVLPLFAHSLRIPWAHRYGPLQPAGEMYKRFALKSFSGCVSTGRAWSSRIRASSGHLSARWFVRIVTRENTTGVWLKEPTAEKREKDTQHAVLRHVKGRL